MASISRPRPQVTRLLHSTGTLDYLTWCWGSHADTLDWHLPDLHGPRAPYVEKIAALAQHAPGVAIGALGLITDPNEGERFVRDGPRRPRDARASAGHRSGLGVEGGGRGARRRSAIASPATPAGARSSAAARSPATTIRASGSPTSSTGGRSRWRLRKRRVVVVGSGRRRAWRPPGWRRRAATR